MLEFYFSYRGVLERLRFRALGAEMDRIAADLSALGYKRASARLYLSRIARFSHFAAAHCGSAPISEAIVGSYLRSFITESPRIAVVSALQHARRVAPERFVALALSAVDDPDAPLLMSFSDYLTKIRGLEPKSRESVLLGARRFLHWFHRHHPGQGLEAVTAQHVLSVVEYRLSLSATSGTRTAATSHIRAFSAFCIGPVVTNKIWPLLFQCCRPCAWRTAAVFCRHGSPAPVPHATEIAAVRSRPR